MRPDGSSSQDTSNSTPYAQPVSEPEDDRVAVLHYAGSRIEVERSSADQLLKHLMAHHDAKPPKPLPRCTWRLNTATVGGVIIVLGPDVPIAIELAPDTDDAPPQVF